MLICRVFLLGLFGWGFWVVFCLFGFFVGFCGVLLLLSVVVVVCCCCVVFCCCFFCVFFCVFWGGGSVVVSGGFVSIDSKSILIIIVES